MLRLNDTVRLSETDKADLRAISGRADVPKSAEQYNRQLDQAARDWQDTDCAEGQLLAWMAADMKLPNKA
jgi:hypothetical protein